MLTFGKKSYFLGPTIYKIPQPNWYYSTPTTTTMGPTTTTEVRPGMNLCNPLMKKKGYEINMVICGANEICQPLSSNGKLAEVGYIVFLTVFKIYIS